MSRYIFYESTSGKITHTISAEPYMAALQQPPDGHAMTQVLDDFSDEGRHYVVNDYVLSRPTFDQPELIEIDADGVDTATIVLPDPCQVSIDGVEETITGGELVLGSDMPAEYTIELIQWPYIPQTVKVIANAPAA